MNIETVTRHYIAAALWSSVDDNCEPLGAAYDLDDIAPETLARMGEDCAAFVDTAKPFLDVADLSEEQIGHDIWLTRNGHGAGFWDRGLGDTGRALTDIAEGFGEVWLYVGDDGLIYD